MEYNGAVGAEMLRRTPLSDYEERKKVLWRRNHLLP